MDKNKAFGQTVVILEGWSHCGGKHVTSALFSVFTQQSWKKRWFVLRSGRLTGDPDVLEYYKNDHTKKPIRVIDLNLCEQVGVFFYNRAANSTSSYLQDVE